MKNSSKECRSWRKGKASNSLPAAEKIEELLVEANVNLVGVLPGRSDSMRRSQDLATEIAIVLGD